MVSVGWSRVQSRALSALVGRGAARAASRRRPPGEWLLVAAMLGCAGPAAERGLGVVRRDSAGVQLVENRLPVWGPGDEWRVEPHPMLVLDTTGAGGVVPPYRVAAVSRLQDRRFAVADGGNQELRIYDSTGVYQDRIAGPGDGPGEFRGLGRLWRFRGDSLMAADWQGWSYELSVFGPDGRLARSWSAALPPGEEGRVAPAAVTGAGDILMITVSTIRGTMPPRVERALERAYVYDGRGRPGPPVGRFPGQLWYRGPETKLSVVGLTISSRFAADAIGFYAGDPDRPVIRRYLTSGTLVRVITIPGSGVPVTDEDLGRERARAHEALKQRYQQLEGWSIPASLRALIEDQHALVDEMPYPETFPPYDAFFTDPRQHLWIRRYRRAGHDDPHAFWVLDAGGRWLGTVLMPPDLSVLEIGDDYVVGVRKDELDIEYIQVHRLYRSSLPSLDPKGR